MWIFRNITIVYSFKHLYYRYSNTIYIQVHEAYYILLWRIYLFMKKIKTYFYGEDAIIGKANLIFPNGFTSIC